jgi:hypothetical protein
VKKRKTRSDKGKPRDSYSWHATDGLMSFEDIAKELGMTKQGVQQLYNRAIKKLHRYYAQHPKSAAWMREALEEDPEYSGDVFYDDHFFPPVWEWDEKMWVVHPKPGYKFFFGRRLEDENTL